MNFKKEKTSLVILFIFKIQKIDEGSMVMKKCFGQNNYKCSWNRNYLYVNL